MKEVAVRSVEDATDKDYYAVLSRIVAAVNPDHVQLRIAIYEFARRKLRKSLFEKFEDGDWAGVQQKLLALEAAIERIESEYESQFPRLTFSPQPPLTYRQMAIANLGARQNLGVTTGGHSAPAPMFRLSSHDIKPSLLADDEDRNARRGKRSRSFFWWSLQLVAATLLGALIYALADGQSAQRILGLSRLDKEANTAAANADNSVKDISPSAKAETVAVLHPNKPGFPIPSDYGVYAIAGRQLIELDLLSMRVPDQRVAISPVISTPSRTHLPAGKLEFVVFRRDLANNAPDRVAVRVVAQVVRALTFDAAGRAVTTNIDNAWVVRSNSYQMRVAPVADNPEMILLRADPPDLAFPAGRYALVLKGAAYDFTLDGSPTDTAHCLERADALTAPVYTECRKPPNLFEELNCLLPSCHQCAFEFCKAVKRTTKPKRRGN